MTTPPPQTGGYTSTLPSSSAPVYPNSTQPTTIESYPVTSYPIETKTHGYPVTTEYCITINGKAYTLLPSESPKPPSPTISYPDFQPLPKTYQPPYGEPPKSGSTPTSPPPIELPPAVELPPGVELPPAVMLPPAVQLPPGERPPPAVELPPGVELPPAVELPPKMEAPSQPPSYVEHPPQGSSEPPSYSPLPKTYQPPNSPPIVELPPAIELPPKMEAPSPPPYVEAPPKQIQASPPPYHAPSPPKETHPAPPPPKETCSTPSAPPVQPPVQPPAPPPANNYSVSIFIPTTNSSPSPTPSSIEYTSPVEHLYPSQTAPSIPVSYAPSQAPPSPAESPKPNPSGVCPLDLPPTFEFPHYMVPVDTSKPEYTSPNSYHGYVSPTSTTILTFDIPPSLSGRTCHAYFALPKHGQMETSEFTLSGSGSFEFAELAGPALAHGLKPADIPATERHLGSWTPTEGSVHEVASGMCNAGGRVTFSMASKGLNFSWFQDYNPCPIGLYIIPE
ncbi:MAG: hypothetical protein M1831_002184 [Alyxoria varia]|nr:MAG: hypothetical protein M1831_002184 [Alyxoria varia]